MRQLIYLTCLMTAVGVPSFSQEWTADCTDDGVPQRLVWTAETTQLVMFGVPVKLVDYNNKGVTLQTIGYGDPYVQLSTETEDVLVAGTLSDRFKCKVDIAQLNITKTSETEVTIEVLLKRIEDLEERIQALEAE